MTDEEKLNEIGSQLPINSSFMTEEEKRAYLQGKYCGASLMLEWKNSNKASVANNYEYAHRNVFCKDEETVDRELNYIYSINKEEDIMSLQVIPYIDPEKTDGLCVPIFWYISYVYRWEKEK